jgi:hypothetical protein
MQRNDAVQYVILASEHSGVDLDLWFRYLRKLVSKTGNVFTEREIAQIMKENRIRWIHRVILSEAVKPGTPTNKYVIGLNEVVDFHEIEERVRGYEKTA